VALSGGADKGETFARLLTERKLGYLALLRNLRNMDQAGVDEDLVKSAIIPGDVRVFTFSNSVVEVPARRGMAGVDAIVRSQLHSGTELGKAVKRMNEIPHQRLIVITDEQSHDRLPDPVAAKAYMINVASARNGVGYGAWTHIDGFSEAVLGYIREHEALTDNPDRALARKVQ
jgi:hypothetical protein